MDYFFPNGGSIYSATGRKNKLASNCLKWILIWGNQNRHSFLGLSASWMHIGLFYVTNAAIRLQNGSNLYDELLNGSKQETLNHGTTILELALKKNFE